MFARTAMAAVFLSGVLVLSGCGNGGGDSSGQRAGGGGPNTLDIAGSYAVVPDNFFNTFTIYQSGNSLTAVDGSGGSWSGTLSNVILEETSGAGGTTLITWRGDVNLTGKNVVGDNLSLTGVVEITLTQGVNLVEIVAEYQNLSIGLTGQLVLTQTSAMPGGALPGGGTITPGGGAGGGAENR